MTQRARTETYDHAISSLLSKREEMTQEIAELRERLAITSNDIESLDRVLERLGYSGDIKLTSRIPRVVLFYRGELRQFLLGQIQEHGSRTSRQMAETLLQLEGKDARDRRLMNDVVKRMGKALRQMVDSRIITRSSEKIRGEFVWTALIAPITMS